MNFEKVLSMILELAALKFFPTEPAAHVALARMCGRMVDSEDLVRRAIDKMLQNYNEWPGPREFRAVFCSIVRPLDGIEAFSNILPEEPLKPRLRITQGEKPTVDQAEIDATLASLAKSLTMDLHKRLGPGRLRELPVNKNFVPVTAADIETERQRLLTERAQKELNQDVDRSGAVRSGNSGDSEPS